MHQQAKVTQIISILEPPWIETISVTNGSKQVHLAESLVGALTRFVGLNRLSRFVAGFLSLFTAARFLSLPLWVRLLSR